MLALQGALLAVQTGVWILLVDHDHSFDVLTISSLTNKTSVKLFEDFVTTEGAMLQSEQSIEQGKVGQHGRADRRGPQPAGPA
jgi:hypothetical protein